MDDGGKDLCQTGPGPVTLAVGWDWEVRKEHADRPHAIVQVMEQCRHIIE